jgi:hypothetical protein
MRAQALKKVELTDYFTRFTYKVRALLGLLGLLELGLSRRLDA